MSTYVKIDGITGPVTTKGYEGCFEATSCSQMVSRHVVTQAGQTDNRQSSQPTITGFQITKQIDKTTPMLHSQAAYSQPKSTVTISFVPNPDLKATLVYTLNDVYISHYSVSMQGDAAVEHLELHPIKFETKYTPRDSQGNTQTPIAAGYDLETAQKC